MRPYADESTEVPAQLLASGVAADQFKAHAQLESTSAQKATTDEHTSIRGRVR